MYSPFSKLQEGEKGFVTTGDVGGVGGELGSPESLPELERPPLRKIDMYIRPDCPCCNMTKRYTVAFLASIGKFNRFLCFVLFVLCRVVSCLCLRHDAQTVDDDASNKCQPLYRRCLMKVNFLSCSHVKLEQEKKSGKEKGNLLL